MGVRHAFIAPLVLVGLVAAATASCATSSSTSGSTAGARGEKEPLVAREVVVRATVDANGGVIVTPDRAIVRSGQKLVLFACCEELRIAWKRPESRIPEPVCKGGECTLVGPAVKEPVTVDYDVFGKCGGKEFRVDPRLVFIP
jgi:hypothetical protein